MRHLITSLFFAFSFLLPTLEAQNEPKIWEITRTKDGKSWQLKQHQKIIVDWKGQSRIVTTKGQLLDISADTVSLALDGKIGAIAKTDIVDIRVKKRSFGERFLNFILVLVSFLITVIAVGLIITDAKRNNTVLTPSELRRMIFMALLGATLTFLGIKKMVSNAKNPYSSNEQWTIREITPTAPNLP